MCVCVCGCVCVCVVGCGSKVTGQDVVVTPLPLFMCSSVTLATAPREVLSSKEMEKQREEEEEEEKWMKG